MMGDMAGMTEFGALIRRAREQRGLTGAELAARIDRPHSFLVRIERGQNANPPDPQTFADLARALGLPTRVMLEALGYWADDTAGMITLSADDPLAEIVAALRAADPATVQTVRALVAVLGSQVPVRPSQDRSA